ncbi:hypothetical protein UlMin_024405 [Ulmus minor]
MTPLQLELKILTDANNEFKHHIIHIITSDIHTVHIIHISQRISHNKHITDHANLILESVHVVGEIVLTSLQCKYLIYLALSKAIAPVLTYSSVRKYRVKGSTKLNVTQPRYPILSYLCKNLKCFILMWLIQNLDNVRAHFRSREINKRNFFYPNLVLIAVKKITVNIYHNYGLLLKKMETSRGHDSHNFLISTQISTLETFLGHTSPISCCRFSASGNNIASASVDGTVRIWTYDSSTSASRNATIYCGGEILSLDWECKSDRLLIIGTADGGIKAWNVDAKRVVCDLNTTEAFPSVFDIKCSPVEPIFVSAAASRRPGASCIDNLGFASLTTVLPLGKDLPAITSLCFTQNGKFLAAVAIDGMIHMFDMSAGLQITGWPAHDSAISSILFGPDETSIFSLGLDGKIFEWSLQNQVQVLWSRNCSRYTFVINNNVPYCRFCDPESSKHCRHEMALDANRRRLLVTSGSVRAPIYQSYEWVKNSPPHCCYNYRRLASDLAHFLTGSVDNSVRVTSIL